MIRIAPGGIALLARYGRALGLMALAFAVAAKDGAARTPSNGEPKVESASGPQTRALAPTGRLDLRASDGRVSAVIAGAPLAAVMERFAKATGIECWITGQLRSEVVDTSFPSLPVEEALRRLLQGKSYALVYGGQGSDRKVREVFILSTRHDAERRETPDPTRRPGYVDPRAVLDALSAGSLPDAIRAALLKQTRMAPAPLSDDELAELHERVQRSVVRGADLRESVPTLTFRPAPGRNSGCGMADPGLRLPRLDCLPDGCGLLTPVDTDQITPVRRKHGQSIMKPSLSLKLLAVLASSLVIATAARPQTVPPVEVKFMTYNVQAPGWNQNRRAQVVGTIDAERPDVLGLHEARANGNGAELMADLQDDYEPRFTNTGDPIYLRRDRSFAVVEEGVEALPVCPGIGGAAVLTWVKIETPEGKRFTFYNTHFCVSRLPGGGQVSPEGNQMQAIATAEFMNVNTEPGTVHLLAGDLNAGQTSPTMLYLLEGQPLELDGVQFGNPIELDDTWELAPGNAGQTHPGTGARGGFTVLDWIVADPFVNVVDAEVLQFDIPPGEEANYSDHLPVTATLQLSGIDNAALEIQLSQESYINGEIVTVSTFRFANPGPEAVAVELKVWLEVPGLAALPVFNLGADGSFVILAGFDEDFGPFALFDVTDDLPRGNYQFSSRLLHPVTGELLNEDLNAFAIQ